MKKLSILSILLLASTSAVTMEGQWNKEETEISAEHQQSSKVPSLASLCFKTFTNPQNPKLLKEFYHPYLSAGIWDEFPQEYIDCDNDYHIDRLLIEEYPAEVKAAMIKRLTLPEELVQKLFDKALDPKNDEVDKSLVACALFVKNPILQTWEIGQKLAESGPITLEAAKVIIHTTRFEWPLLVIDNDNYFPEAMLCYNNHAIFKQAIVKLIKEKKLEGPYVESSTLLELCNAFMRSASTRSGQRFKSIPISQRTKGEAIRWFGHCSIGNNKENRELRIEEYTKYFSREKIEKENNEKSIELSNIDFDAPTAKQDILHALSHILPSAFQPSTLTKYLQYYQHHPLPYYAVGNSDLIKDRIKLVCDFIKKAQQYGFEDLTQEKQN